MLCTQMQLPVAEDLLRTIEGFAVAIGDVLAANFSENDSDSRNITLPRNNIGTK